MLFVSEGAVAQAKFMKKIMAGSNLDGKQESLPDEAIGITRYQVMEKIPFEVHLKKTLSVDYSLVDDCFLSPDDFRMQLRREKRRVERSSAPLSIVLFQLNESVLSNKFQLKNFLDSIRTRTRETDIKGWVDSKTIGYDSSGYQRRRYE